MSKQSEQNIKENDFVMSLKCCIEHNRQKNTVIIHILKPEIVLSLVVGVWHLSSVQCFSVKSSFLPPPPFFGCDKLFWILFLPLAFLCDKDIIKIFILFNLYSALPMIQSWGFRCDYVKRQFNSLLVVWHIHALTKYLEQRATVEERI